MRAHDRRVEHLDEMCGRTHRGERVKEGFENAGLAQPVEAFPHAVPRTEAIWQGAPPNVLNRKELERLEEAPIILGLPSPSREAGDALEQRDDFVSNQTCIDILAVTDHAIASEAANGGSLHGIFKASSVHRSQNPYRFAKLGERGSFNDRVYPGA